MELIWQGLVKAIDLLVSGDLRLWGIVLLTLVVSGTATLLSTLAGVPAGVALALARFPGRRPLIGAVNTGMGLPPVVIGLLVSMLLWRYGPFGFLGVMYTPVAMIVAQTIIATPVVTGFTLAGIAQQNPKLPLQILALGASRRQLYWLLAREARFPIMAAIIAGFGRAISEVGASMMVGGNILGQTRVMTTAVVLEVNKGSFDVAIALGIILLLLAYGVTLALTAFQQRG